MSQGRRFWLVYNEASGSNDEAAIAELEAAFDHAGCPLLEKRCFPNDHAPEAGELDAAGVGSLAVFAGDGTVSAVVTGLYGWGGSILVLPGGTMNLLSQRLHGAARPAEIVGRLKEGIVRPVRPAVIRSRIGDALTGVIAGPGAAWAEVREAMRRTDLPDFIASAADAIGESTNGARVVCRQPMCGRDDGYAAVTLVPTESGLEVSGYCSESAIDYARQLVALLQRDFRVGPHEELGMHASVGLACPGGERMALLLDGESCEADAEEAFMLARCEVDLLATAEAA